MTAEQWAQVRALLDLALDEPARRPALLDDLRRRDPEACAELERLIADLESVDGAEDEADGAAPPIAGLEVGPYKIVREIGRGGAGTVYLATRDEAGVELSFALKLLRRDFLRGAPRRSFHRELRALARLNHPNIARLIDWGSVPGGLFYLALEYVEGRTITEHCARERLGLAARLALFLDVCGAVEHAHRNLVVHRDLKPSNILVTGGEPARVKLLDFGIAAELDATAEPTTLLNRALTPAYASPEQMQGKSVAVATDVYSLGLVFYELLAGQLPYAKEADPFWAALHQQPQPPSRRAIVGDVSSRELEGDLDAIVLKAIRHEPEERYPSVEQFAADLRRHIEGRPVEARRPSRLYVAGRFLRRNRINVGAAALVATGLAVTAGVAIWKWRDAAHNLAESQREYRTLRDFAQAVIANVDARTAASPVEAQRRISATVLRYLDQLSQERPDDEPLQLQIASAYAYLGNAQGAVNNPNQGDPGSALANYRKAYAIVLARWRAGASRASGVQLVTMCGNIASIMPDPGPAVEFLSSAIEAGRVLVARDPRDQGVLQTLANTHGIQGQRRRLTGDLPGALSDFQESIDLSQRLLGVRPKGSDALASLEVFTSEKGTTLRMLGRLEDALTAQDEATRIATDLMAQSPGRHARRQAAFKLLSRCETLRRMSRYDEASRDVRQAKVELAALAAQDPADDQAKADLSLADLRMADLAASQNRFRDALPYLADAERLRQEQFAKHPSSPQALRSYQGILVRFAQVELAAQAPVVQTAAGFDKAIALGSRYHQLAPSDVYAEADQARAYRGAAECALRRGRRSEAINFMRQSLDAWSDVRKRSPQDVDLAAEAQQAGQAQRLLLP